MAVKPKLFIDSGAFSANSKGESISIPEYASFLKRWEKYVSLSAGLDVIYDPEGTWRNQKEIESYGLTPTPIPTFHIGEPWDWLVKYVNEYDYIGLGGTASKKYGSAERMVWLDTAWGDYLTDDDGIPLTRVHGFAATGLDVMRRYPWFSVDSTSWIMSSATGKAQFYEDDPWSGQPDILTIDVSETSPAKAKRGAHPDTMTPMHREALDRIITKHGFELQKLATDYKERFLSNAKAYSEFARAVKYKPFRLQRGGDLFGGRPNRSKRKPVPAWDHLTFYLAGEPTTEVSRNLILRGYNRLLSYFYIKNSPDRHFKPTIEALDTYEGDNAHD